MGLVSRSEALGGELTGETDEKSGMSPSVFLLPRLKCRRFLGSASFSPHLDVLSA